MYLLQPLACFAHPCASCLGHSDIFDSSSNSNYDTHGQDNDNCESSICCADYTVQLPEIMLSYAPLISSFVLIEQYHKLPLIILPIFIPPQNLA
jgi:hypothetical protein